MDKARQGDKSAMKGLIEAVRSHLHEHVNRLTLDKDLTDEIVQETLIKMIEQLPTLRQSDQFWPWLSKIALNRMRRYYRDNGKRRIRSLDSAQPQESSSHDHTVVADAITNELRQIVLSAMRQLKPHLRTVLVLRCYEQLSFPEIADRTGSSEFKARALFVRAKHALGKKLASNGFGKSSLLGALLIFGKMTATSEASLAGVSVSAGTVWAGWLPTLSVAITSKMALVTLVSVACLSVVGPTLLPAQAPAQWPMAYGQQAKQPDHQTHQHWYYYPPESPGTVQIQIRSGRDNRTGSPILLQNEHANYARTDKEVFICDAHMWHEDGSVMRLPTDGLVLTEFLNSIEGQTASSRPVRIDPTGLLVIKEDQKPWHALPDFDVADEGCYRSQWRKHLKINDQRDVIHKRGWTHFSITGELRGAPIIGTGCMPLVSAKRKEVTPWIHLQIGDNVILEDNGRVAFLKNSQGQMLKQYRGGTFFQGMARPWQGLHTIDTVRRDAAKQQIVFDTELPNESDTAVIRLDCGSVHMAYRILMQADLIGEIAFSLSDGAEGTMRFAYPLELEESNQSAIRSNTSFRTPPRNRGPGMTWLVELANGTLGR
ncbi:MAG: RNA polymerase sigma factor [Planctomycetes bacterium]|nr:RNA polymerase sigma factor [Planctomycetota bacterium]